MLSKNYSSFVHFKYKRLLYFFACFFITIALSGCSADASVPPSGNVPSTLAPSGSEEISGSILVSPEFLSTPTPVPTAAPADGYSAETAAQLINEALPGEHYKTSLISSSLNIENHKFYTFLITQKGAAIEPLIIVDQKTGELKCISSDNVVSDISTHPLYKELNTELVSWEGTYIIKREDGTLSNYIVMTPSDNTHFEFTTYVYLETGTSELSGVASIQDSMASFTSESGIVLHFSWNKANLVIEQQSAAEGLDFSGTYQFTEDTDSTISQISMEEAMQKLLSLDPRSAVLSGNMEDYYFYVQDGAVIVSDHLCYSILAYSELDNRLFFAAQFYITVDGSSIFRQRSVADNRVVIFSIQ